MLFQEGLQSIQSKAKYTDENRQRAKAVWPVYLGFIYSRFKTAEITWLANSQMSGVHVHDLLWVWYVMWSCGGGLCLGYVDLECLTVIFHALSNVRLIDVWMFYWHLLNIYTQERFLVQINMSISSWPFGWWNDE